MDGWDPVAWLNAGFQVGIWAKVLPVRAQSMDIQGLLLANTPAFSVRPTGQTGSMTLLRADVSLYEGLIDASAGAGDYLTTVTVDAASATPVIYRRNFTCDACHPTPPGHIATPAIWGKCNQCHNLSSNIHIHAYNAGIAADNCYQCHPTGSLNSVHSQQIGLWCIDCHGTLLDAPNNQMNISGQLGLPHCADCHDLLCILKICLHSLLILWDMADYGAAIVMVRFTQKSPPLLATKIAGSAIQLRPVFPLWGLTVKNAIPPQFHLIW
jgi:hypothetical protein